MAFGLLPLAIFNNIQMAGAGAAAGVGSATGDLEIAYPELVGAATGVATASGIGTVFFRLTVSELTTAFSTVSATSIDVIDVTADVGVMLVLAAAADNAGTSGVASLSDTVTDSAGNTWINQQLLNYSPTSTNSGTTLGIWTCHVMSALAAGTVTLSFSPSTVAKAAAIWQVEGISPSIYVIGSGATGSSAAPSSGVIASVPEGYTVFGFVATENSADGAPDSDTTHGTWSDTFSSIANLGTVATSQVIAGQFKNVISSGDQTYDRSYSGSRDWAASGIVLFDAAMVGVAAGTAAAAAVGYVDTLAAIGTAHGTGGGIGVGNSIFALVGTASATGSAYGIADAAAPTTGITMPAEIPRPTIGGYRVRIVSNVVRASMEFGAARVRRRGTRPLCQLDVAWTLSTWQQMLFEAFYRWSAQEGGAWFDMELAFPIGIRWVTARFTGDLNQQPLGANVWRVTTALEVLQRPVLSDAELTAILDDAGAEPAWPSDRSILPLPTYEGYLLTDKAVLARTGDDLRGLPAQRRRSLDRVTEISARWVLGADQAATFDAFFKYRAREGARWFTMPVFSGIGLWDAQARFQGETTWQPVGGDIWAVEAPMEARERTILTAADLALTGKSMDLPEAVALALDYLLAQRAARSLYLSSTMTPDDEDVGYGTTGTWTGTFTVPVGLDDPPTDTPVIVEGPLWFPITAGAAADFQGRVDYPFYSMQGWAGSDGSDSWGHYYVVGSVDGVTQFRVETGANSAWSAHVDDPPSGSWSFQLVTYANGTDATADTNRILVASAWLESERPGDVRDYYRWAYNAADAQFSDVVVTPGSTSTIEGTVAGVGGIDRFDPKFWTVNFDVKAMGAVVTVGDDGLDVTAMYRNKGSLVALIWESVDRWSHPWLKYETSTDYDGVDFYFDIDVSDSSDAADLDNGYFLLTVEHGADQYYLPVWSYRVDGGDTDNRTNSFKVPFRTGMMVNAYVDGVFHGDGSQEIPITTIDTLKFSIIPGVYDGTNTAITPPVAPVFKFRNMRVEGAGTSLVRDSRALAALTGDTAVRITDGYDSTYPLTPRRVIEDLYQLGWRDFYAMYIGTTQFLNFAYNAGSGRYDDYAGRDALNPACAAWFADFFGHCVAKGFTTNWISVSFEILLQFCPTDWMQRDANSDPATLGYTPPSTRVKYINTDALDFLAEVGKAFMALQVAGGLAPRLQLGEPDWWVNIYAPYGDGTDGPPCIYGADILTLYNTETSLFSPTPYLTSVAGALVQGSVDYEPYLMWLSGKIGAATDYIRDAVLAVYPTALTAILKYPSEGGVIYTTMNAAPANWEYPNYDWIMVESYNQVILGDPVTIIDDTAYGALGYPASRTIYFSGFALEGYTLGQDLDTIQERIATDLLVQRDRVDPPAVLAYWARPEAMDQGVIAQNLFTPGITAAGLLASERTYQILVTEETDVEYAWALEPMTSAGAFSISRDQPINGAVKLRLVEQVDGASMAVAGRAWAEENVAAGAGYYPDLRIEYRAIDASIPAQPTSLQAAALDGAWSMMLSAASLGRASLVDVNSKRIYGRYTMPSGLMRSYIVPPDDAGQDTSSVYYDGFMDACFLYDQAVALIAFLQFGRKEDAALLVEALLRVQNDSGAFPFANGQSTLEHDTSLLRSGAIAWVAYALLSADHTQYRASFTIRPDAAAKAALAWLLDQRNGIGLVTGGPDVSWWSTEHNIDAWWALDLADRLYGSGAIDYRGAADTIKAALLAYAWDAGSGTFWQGGGHGVDPTENDGAHALDTHTWGAALLHQWGEAAKAQTSMDRAAALYYVTDGSTGRSGYTTVIAADGAALGTVETPWYEGSFGAVVALRRLDPAAAGRLLRELNRGQRDDGSWLYALAADAVNDIHPWPCIIAPAWAILAHAGVAAAMAPVLWEQRTTLADEDPEALFAAAGGLEDLLQRTRLWGDT